MVINHNKRLEQKEAWENYDPNNIILECKVPPVLDLIPEDVQTIIDIGCGNGIITNILSEKYKTLGVDISEAALKYVKGEKLCVSSGKIPVENESFDLAFTSELLEHLPLDVYNETLKEIKRIAQKYIIVSVPNDENIDASLSRCPKCNFVFSRNGHIQSFSKQKLQKLFGDSYKMTSFATIGPNGYRYNDILLKVRQKIANKYYSPKYYAICPKCDNINFPKEKKGFIAKACDGANIVFRRRKKSWMIAIYKKQHL